MPVIGVYVRSFSGVAKPIDAYVEVKFAGKAFDTTSLENVKEGSWDEVFVMNVKDVASPENVLKLKLIDDQKMRKDPTIGKMDPISIPEILHQGELFEARKAYHLKDPSGKVTGQLEVQIFTEKEKPEGPLSVLCCSWNVGNAPPPDNLSSWLKGVKDGQHHVVAIAAQECNYKLEKTGKETAAELEASSAPQDDEGTMPVESTPSIDDVKSADSSSSRYNKLVHKLKRKLKGTSYLWETHMTKAMGDKYWLLVSKHMGQIRMLVYVRVDLAAAIDLNSIHVDDEATGIGHVVSNKGGVGVHINIYNTDLTFVGCHLAAHQDKVKARNEDYREIIKGLDLDPYGSDVLNFPHHVFWMGDLNYRLNWGEQAQNPTETPTEADWTSLVTEIDSKAYEKLLKLDQLQKEIDEKRVLPGFREGPINFAPTFKVNRAVSPTSKGEEYYIRKRSPAWCDRILVRSNLPHKQAVPSDYFSAPEVTTSDHKPVGCIFSVPIVATPQAPPHATRDLAPEQYELEIHDITSTGTWTEVAGDWGDLELKLAGPPLAEKVTVPMGDSGEVSKVVKVLLKPAPLQALLDERVLMRVEGTDVESMTVGETIGRTVLALSELVGAAKNGTAEGLAVKLACYDKGVIVGEVNAVVKLQPASTPAEKKPKKGIMGLLGKH